MWEQRTSIFFRYWCRIDTGGIGLSLFTTMVQLGTKMKFIRFWVQKFKAEDQSKTQYDQKWHFWHCKGDRSQRTFPVKACQSTMYRRRPSNLVCSSWKVWPLLACKKNLWTSSFKAQLQMPRGLAEFYFVTVCIYQTCTEKLTSSKLKMSSENYLNIKLNLKW